MEVYKWNNEDRLVQCCPEEAWFFFCFGGGQEDYDFYLISRLTPRQWAFCYWGA